MTLFVPDNTCGRLDIQSPHQRTFQDRKVCHHREKRFQEFGMEVRALKDQVYFLLPEILPVLGFLLAVAAVRRGIYLALTFQGQGRKEPKRSSRLSW